MKLFCSFLFGAALLMSSCNRGDYLIHSFYESDDYQNAGKVLSNKVPIDFDSIVPIKSPSSSYISTGQKGPQPGRFGKLTDQEMQMAKNAWVYFENNFQKETCLVNAVNDYPSTTLWDTSSYMAALLSAYEFDIIKKDKFHRRLTCLLETFNKIEFFNDELPNKVYNTKTGAKVDYANQPGEIGFSALDLGRLLIWLKIIKERFPQHGNAIDNFLLRWHWCNMLDDNGTLYGSVKTADGDILYVQEGRLGYEEYAAKGFQLWGFNTYRASLPDPYEIIEMFDVKIPYDRRDPRQLAAHNYVVAESYVLDGIEMNWDLVTDRSSDDLTHTHNWMAKFAQRIYQVQEERYKKTGIITARTEHQLDGPPYFVYDTIYSSGHAWNTITDAGEYVPEFSAIALKGALGLWGLWDTSYTDLLFNTISDLFDPEKGYYEGKYENGKGVIKEHTANNNGIMMSVLLYKKIGKILQFQDHPNLWSTMLGDQFTSNQNCLLQGRTARYQQDTMKYDTF